MVRGLMWITAMVMDVRSPSIRTELDAVVICARNWAEELQMNAASKAGLMALLIPYALFLGGPKKGDPFEVRDSQGRVRLKAVDGDGGAFRLVLLDASGKEVIALNPDAEAGALVAIEGEGRSIKLGGLGGGEYGCEVHGESVAARLSDAGGLTVRNAKGERRAWVEFKEEIGAEVGVQGRGGRPTAIVSQAGRSGLVVANSIGLMRAGDAEVMWMGDGPKNGEGEDDLASLRGVMVLNRQGHGCQLRMQSSIDSAHVLVQAVEGQGSGMLIGGGEKKAGIKVAIKDKGIADITVVDGSGAVKLDTAR